MTGFEAIGLTLALFPVAVSAVSAYRGKLTEHDLRYLDLSLGNQAAIFFNASVELLTIVVSSDQLTRLLKSPGGDVWKNQDIESKLRSHLGEDGGQLFKTAIRIRDVIGELQQRLPTLMADSPPRSFRRARHIVSLFVKGPETKASMSRLKALVSEFREIAEQDVRLAPGRKKSAHPLNKLRSSQQSALALYEAVQQGWRCECDHGHFVRLRLEVWPSDSASISSDEHPRFTFLFALTPSSSDNASSDEWRHAEIGALPNDPRPTVSSWSSAGLGSATWNSNDSSPETLTSQGNFGQLTTSPTSTVNIGLTTLPPSHESPTSLTSPGTGEAIPCLCKFLAKFDAAEEDGGACLGCLTNRKGEKFGVYRASDPKVSPVSPLQSMPLSELHKDPPEDQTTTPQGPISARAGFGIRNMPGSVSLARTLGWNVLQLQTTHWLEEHWNAEHIFLVAGRADSLLTYITHEFQSEHPENQLSLTISQDRDRLVSWAQNEELFTLGIILIELCYGQKLSSMQIPEDKGNDCLIAMRLSKKVGDRFGSRYEDAVRGCLYPGSREPNLENEDFQLWMYDHVISPLEALASVCVR